MLGHGVTNVVLLTCIARRRAAATSTSSIPAGPHAAAPPPAGTHIGISRPVYSRYLLLNPGVLSHVRVTIK